MTFDRLDIFSDAIKFCITSGGVVCNLLCCYPYTHLMISNVMKWGHS